MGSCIIFYLSVSSICLSFFFSWVSIWTQVSIDLIDSSYSLLFYSVWLYVWLIQDSWMTLIWLMFDSVHGSMYNSSITFFSINLLTHFWLTSDSFLTHVPLHAWLCEWLSALLLLLLAGLWDGWGVCYKGAWIETKILRSILCQSPCQA